MNAIARLALGSALALGCMAPANALSIVLNDKGGVTAGTAAFTGFRAAANFWEKMITTNVTVNLDVSFASTGFSSPNVIGSTGSRAFIGVAVQDVQTILKSTGTSTLDSVAAQNLPQLTTVNTQFGPLGAVAAITQKPGANGNGVLVNVKDANGVEIQSNREYDNDGSRNNWDLRVNSSVLKALGYALPGDPATPDGTIRFNSAFNFDFNPLDGVGVGQIDFIGTAIHEIGHALGFTSGVDLYDNNTGIAANLDTLQGLMSTLDLFRYSANTGDLGPGGPLLDWSIGGQGANRPYFSIDGGLTNGLTAYGGGDGNFSTGRNFGDGNQASHWQDTPYMIAPGDQGPGGLRCLAPVFIRGVMDPTGAPCEESVITALDIAAFDAMGWNVSFDVLASPNKTFTSAHALVGIGAVPEPATWAMMIGGFGLVGGALRRRARASVSYA